MIRFLKAQNNLTISGLTVYEKSIEEISQGYLKIHCWIRYLFPQLSGLGQSEVTKFYEIKSREEALEYMQNELLRTRYLNCCQAILNSNKSIHEIFGYNAIKIRASLLLMNSVWDDIWIKQLLIKHCWI
jgi:uncharacterized protein (DUF1810 family)